MDMAGKDNQRLTFYEDFYLKSLKRLKSHPQSPSASKGQHLSRHSKEKRSMNSSNKESQKLGKRPHSANGRLLRTTSDEDEILPELLKCSAPTPCNTLPTTLTNCNKENNNNIYETVSKPNLDPVDDTKKYASLPLTRKSSHNNRFATVSDEHIYEVLPCVRRRGEDETRDYYCMPCKSRRAQSQTPIIRQSQSPQQVPLKPTSNLRSMRLMGRSMDSIKLVQGAKLRNQSPVIAPVLWMKENNYCGDGSGRSKYASSCTSITDSVACFGRLSHGFASLERENASLHPNRLAASAERQRTISRSTCSSSSSSQSLTKRKSADDISQKSSSSSIHSAGSRCSPRPGHSSIHHTKQLQQQPAGSTEKARPYENVQFPPKPASADYVNVVIPAVRNQEELNYADLDFSELPPSKPNVICPSPNIARTVSKHYRQDSSTGNTDTRGDDSHIEYTMINITATEAARKACAQQQLYRQRKTYIKSQSCI